MSKKKEVEQEFSLSGRKSISERDFIKAIAHMQQQRQVMDSLSGEHPLISVHNWGKRPERGVMEEVDVAVIHKDFRSVADRLLREAKEIINKAKPDERVKRYKNLGFGGIVRVKDHDAAHEKKEQREKLLGLINDYKVRYPLCQFIDSESLDELCKKYGLVYAPAEYFNQEIPEENLRELEGFKLKKGDEIFKFINTGPGITPTVYASNYKEAYTHRGIYREDQTSQEELGFDVVATEDMFDVPSGFKFHGSTLRAQVKDPIVLKRVPKGFLIVTAWGPEAELPELNLDKQ